MITHNGKSFEVSPFDMTAKYIVTTYREMHSFIFDEWFAMNDLEITLQWLRSQKLAFWEIKRAADNVVIAQQAHYIIKSID